MQIIIINAIRAHNKLNKSWIFTVIKKFTLAIKFYESVNNLYFHMEKYVFSSHVRVINYYGHRILWQENIKILLLNTFCKKQQKKIETKTVLTILTPPDIKNNGF